MVEPGAGARGPIRHIRGTLAAHRRHPPGTGIDVRERGGEAGQGYGPPDITGAVQARGCPADPTRDRGAVVARGPGPDAVDATVLVDVARARPAGVRAVRDPLEVGEAGGE